MLEHIFSHFSVAGHNRFLTEVSITFIDKTDPSDPLQREDYWRQTLKTMVVFVFTFLQWQHQFFYTVMSACFEDYDFKITVLSVNTVVSFVYILFSLTLLSLLLSFSISIIATIIIILYFYFR